MGTGSSTSVAPEERRTEPLRVVLVGCGHANIHVVKHLSDPALYPPGTELTLVGRTKGWGRRGINGGAC